MLSILSCLSHCTYIYRKYDSVAPGSDCADSHYMRSILSRSSTYTVWCTTQCICVYLKPKYDLICGINHKIQQNDGSKIYIWNKHARFACKCKTIYNSSVCSHSKIARAILNIVSS